MNKTVVIYKSKYGSIEKYAKWIAEDLSCDIYERSKVKPADLEPYRTIVYGGGLYADGVNGIDLFTKNFDQFRNKNLILFTCGLADPSDQENTDHIKSNLNKIFSSEMQKQIKVFHLRGAINYAKLGPVHKAMMAMLHKMLSKKEPQSLRNEDKQMLATYGKVVDFTNRAAISPLIQYVQSL